MRGDDKRSRRCWGGCRGGCPSLQAACFEFLEVRGRLVAECGVELTPGIEHHGEVQLARPGTHLRATRVSGVSSSSLEEGRGCRRIAGHLETD